MPDYQLRLGLCNMRACPHWLPLPEMDVERGRRRARSSSPLPLRRHFPAWRTPISATSRARSRPRTAPSQVEDTDKPKDPSLLDKKPADAAVAAEEQAPVGPPFYEKWQFWAIAGGVVVGAVALDLRRPGARSPASTAATSGPATMDFQGRCFGEGH